MQHLEDKKACIGSTPQEGSSKFSTCSSDLWMRRIVQGWVKWMMCFTDNCHVFPQIFVHNDLESLFKHVPRKLLPKDYGGEAASIESIISEWEKRLMSYRTYYQEEDSMYGVDEVKRVGQAKNANSNFGVDGTFRQLTIDWINFACDILESDLFCVSLGSCEAFKTWIILNEVPLNLIFLFSFKCWKIIAKYFKRSKPSDSLHLFRIWARMVWSASAAWSRTWARGSAAWLFRVLASPWTAWRCRPASAATSVKDFQLTIWSSKFYSIGIT